MGVCSSAQNRRLFGLLGLGRAHQILHELLDRLTHRLQHPIGGLGRGRKLRRHGLERLFRRLSHQSDLLYRPTDLILWVHVLLGGLLVSACGRLTL